MEKASEVTGKGSVLTKLREEHQERLTAAAAQKAELPLTQRGLEGGLRSGQMATSAA